MYLCPPSRSPRAVVNTVPINEPRRKSNVCVSTQHSAHDLKTFHLSCFRFSDGSNLVREHRRIILYYANSAHSHGVLDKFPLYPRFNCILGRRFRWCLCPPSGRRICRDHSDQARLRQSTKMMVRVACQRPEVAPVSATQTNGGKAQSSRLSSALDLASHVTAIVLPESIKFAHDLPREPLDYKFEDDVDPMDAADAGKHGQLPRTARSTLIAQVS